MTKTTKTAEPTVPPKKNINTKRARKLAADASKAAKNLDIADLSRKSFNDAMDIATFHGLSDISRFLDRTMAGIVDDVEFARSLNEPNKVILSSIAKAFDRVNGALGALQDYTSESTTFANSAVYNDFLEEFYTQCTVLINQMSKMSAANPQLYELFAPQLILKNYDLSGLFVTLQRDKSQPNLLQCASGSDAIPVYELLKDQDKVDGVPINETSIALAPLTNYIKLEVNDFIGYPALSSLELYWQYEDEDENKLWGRINSGSTGTTDLKTKYAAPLTYLKVDGITQVNVPGGANGLYHKVVANVTDFTDTVGDGVWICYADYNGLEADSGDVLAITKNQEDPRQFQRLSDFKSFIHNSGVQNVVEGQWYFKSTKNQNLPDFYFAMTLMNHLNMKSIHHMKYMGPGRVGGKVIEKIDFPTKQFGIAHTLNFKSNSTPLNLVAPPYYAPGETLDAGEINQALQMINLKIPAYQQYLSGKRDACYKIIVRIDNEIKSIQSEAKNALNELEILKESTSASFDVKVDNLEEE